MIELCESRGDFRDAANWLVMLTKAGESQALIDGRLNELRNKMNDDQDIPIWESRLDAFRGKEEWGKALKEVGKLLEKYSLKVGRLKNRKLNQVEQQEKGTSASDETLDPNISGELTNTKLRLQELRGLEADLKDKLQ